MKQSQLFPKTQKNHPAGAQSINHKLLVRAGFVDQLMAGSWTLLPLGFRVLDKINNIIREELNKTGAQELLMPLLHPKEIWDQTGRWSNKEVQEIMYQFKDIHNREFGLSFTHEEIALDLVKKHVSSYKDFPIKFYHFSTKFRNELRAKSGVLRGREFLMNDLYSFHASKEDLDSYYLKVAEIYKVIFKRMDLDVVQTEAAGGVFTEGYTHEFQLISPAGEDEIIYCPGGDFAQNSEIATVSEGKQCDLGHGPLKKVRGIEVGNIFRFDTSYSEKMNVSFLDRDGQRKFAYLGSYGIGTTRLIGAIAEVFNDDRGLIWPKSVAPFDVHLVHIEDSGTESWAKKTYEKLTEAGIEVLWDDRENVSAGEKFADCDLIGIPVRLVVSKKVGDGKVEWKGRDKKEPEMMNLEQAISRLTK